MEKRQLAERDNEGIAVARKYELLGLSCSSYYYSNTQGEYHNF
jgi:hypothetical protein